ncbi:MAG: molybdopterin-dependent oxidoreductase [Actinomycetia bacterium]|nr:molybdopterin-dependent oxidoreductase [Actinomycetes bacterium]
MSQTSIGARMGAGLAAAAVALGVTQLAAAFFSPAADSRTAVGTSVINLTPGPVKEWAIQTFGTADKTFLTVMVLVVIAVLAASSAIWERSRIPLGSIVLAGAGLLGCLAVLSRPGAAAADLIPTLLGTASGIAGLRLLTSDRIREQDPTETPDPGRRRSLLTLGFVGAGALSGVVGTVLTRQRRSVAADRDSFALPKPASPAPAITPDVQPDATGLPRFITPNNQFYRIDTALNVPQVSREDWKLRVHGMVDREVTYSYADLEQFEAVQAAVTLTCVSNPVGGNLISNAMWTGYRVRDLLRRSGVSPDADMVLSTSVDGFTVGTPVEALTDDRDAMLAIGMNGVPLPVEHGYPARLVVPGLYGFVSATKWVVDLELTRFDQAEAFWTKRGWSAKAPIKTQSRIDIPRDGARVSAGAVTVGGVAWAQHRGIEAVEVRIDDGPWQPATLGAAYSKDTWRLWTFDWQADSGPHTLTVRATDDTGAVQTEQPSAPAPDGASGWPSISIEVR